ncbi:MAG TPA: hypothetical protein VFI91_07695 [Longimicrobiaceae bacterium]|nr:hypothetical protein [Longimicrobiaceae bacterium]
MRSKLALIAIVGFVLPSMATAQSPLESNSLSVELRGELAYPTATLNDRFDLESGFGFGIAGKYAIAPILTLYAGWDRFEFDGGAEDAGVELVDRGVRLGAQVESSEPVGPITPFATAGLIFNRASLEITNSRGTTKISGERSVGYEIGGGGLIPLIENFWLVPEVRFRSHPSSWEAATGATEVRITYFALNLGLVIRIPR